MRASLGVKHAQGIWLYFSTIAHSKSFKLSPLGSTKLVKYLVPTQLSSTITEAPTACAMLWTFQLGIAMGQPEIITLGASFAVTPSPLRTRSSSSSQSSLTFVVKRFTSSLKLIWKMSNASKPLIGVGLFARKSDRRLRALRLLFISSMASFSFSAVILLPVTSSSLLLKASSSLNQKALPCAVSGL